MGLQPRYIGLQPTPHRVAAHATWGCRLLELGDVLGYAFALLEERALRRLEMHGRLGMHGDAWEMHGDAWRCMGDAWGCMEMHEVRGCPPPPVCSAPCADYSTTRLEARELHPVLDVAHL
eukprot:scaffold14019_cov46-Phaeocystis_antarctica.AAC.2